MQTRQSDCDGSAHDFDYDHGPLTKLLIRLGLKESKNLRVYGSVEPPRLDAKNIRIPIKLYYSVGDNLSTEKVSDFDFSDETSTLSADVMRADEGLFTILWVDSFSVVFAEAV